MDTLARSARNGLVGHGLDRLAERRCDAAWVRAEIARPRAGLLLVCGTRQPFTGEDAPRPLVVRGDRGAALLECAQSVSLLGRGAGSRTWFALGLAEEAADRVPREGGARLRQLREVAPLLERGEGALLAYARAMAWWHRRHRHCGGCGAPTRSEHAGFLRTCSAPGCGARAFPRTDPAVIVLITNGDRCLLGRQNGWPAGVYSTLAGFVEPGETIEETVLREMREEAGVRVSDLRYRSSQPWPFPSSLMLGFRAATADEDIAVERDELEDARWFTRTQIREGLERGGLRLPFHLSIAYRLVEEWYDEGGGVALAELAGGPPG